MDEKTTKVECGDAEVIKLLNSEFPPNTHKKAKEVKPKAEKIIEGSVVQRKKPLGKRISEMFGGANAAEVAHYVIYDVVIPAAKTTISEMVSGGIEMLLFGETKARRTTRDRGKSYVNYGGFSQQAPKRTERPVDSRNRARLNFDDIILDSRGEAEDVLTQLVDLTQDYGQATVADLYDLVGITSAFTDNKYGWVSLANAKVSRVREGYLIDLPRPVVID